MNNNNEFMIESIPEDFTFSNQLAMLHRVYSPELKVRDNLWILSGPDEYKWLVVNGYGGIVGSCLNNQIVLSKELADKINYIPGPGVEGGFKIIIPNRLRECFKVIEAVHPNIIQIFSRAHIFVNAMDTVDVLNTCYNLMQKNNEQ